MKSTFLASLVVFALPLTVHAGDEHHYKQHAAHEHGTAQLNLVQEQQTLMLELTLSNMDVLGFEHAPSNQEQAQAIEKAGSVLADVEHLLTFNPAAVCTVTSAQAQRKALEHHEDDHEDGHEDEHEHEHDEGMHKESTHSEFQAQYAFNCQQPEQLKTITVQFFDVFPSLEKIQVQMVTDKGQGADQLTAQHSHIELP